MGAGNWPLILKLGRISKFGRAGFLIFGLVFCVTWLWSWQKRQLWRVNRQSRTGLIYYMPILIRYYFYLLPPLLPALLPPLLLLLLLLLPLLFMTVFVIIEYSSFLFYFNINVQITKQRSFHSFSVNVLHHRPQRSPASTLQSARSTQASVVTWLRRGEAVTFFYVPSVPELLWAILSLLWVNFWNGFLLHWPCLVESVT